MYLEMELKQETLYDVLLKLKDNHRRVARHLLERSDISNLVHADIYPIACELSISRSTVRRALDRLQKLDLLREVPTLSSQPVRYMINPGLQSRLKSLVFVSDMQDYFDSLKDHSVPFRAFKPIRRKCNLQSIVRSMQEIETIFHTQRADGCVIRPDLFAIDLRIDESDLLLIMDYMESIGRFSLIEQEKFRENEPDLIQVIFNKEVMGVTDL